MRFITFFLHVYVFLLHSSLAAHMPINSVVTPRTDLWIAGAGTLGTLIAQEWKRLFPASTVVAETRTKANHDLLRRLDVIPTLRSERFQPDFSVLCKFYLEVLTLFSRQRMLLFASLPIHPIPLNLLSLVVNICLKSEKQQNCGAPMMTESCSSYPPLECTAM